MGNSIKGSKKQYLADGRIYHFLYIYIDEEDNNELASITKTLLNIILPNIPKLENNKIYVEVFQIYKHTLKNKELIKLLKKNNILKLPALKIYNGSENMLIIGANQIIEYYTKYLGLSMDINSTPNNPMANRPTPNRPTPNRPMANRPMANRPMTAPNRRTPQLNKTPPIRDDEDDDDLPIGSNKNMTSKLDEMLKFREMSKQEYKNNNISNDDNSNDGNGNSRSREKQNQTHPTQSAEDLKDSPFKEDEFLNDGLDDNLDDNLSSYTSSLLSSASNTKTNAYSNMGDDEADDEKDELMIRAFWDNNFND